MPDLSAITVTYSSTFFQSKKDSPVMFGRPAMGAKVFRSEAVFFNVEKRAAYPLILIANNYIHLFKCLFIYVYVLTLYALSLNIEIKFVLICWTTGFDLFSLFHTVQIRTTIIY